MTRLYLLNKRRLGVSYLKYFRRSRASIVSFSATTVQVFKLGLFGENFKNDHYVIKVFVGLINGLISRSKNSGQNNSIQFLAPFFILPLLFFNPTFRSRFSVYLGDVSNTKFSL